MTDLQTLFAVDNKNKPLFDNFNPLFEESGISFRDPINYFSDEEDPLRSHR